MQISAKKVVYIHYTLTNASGELLDKSNDEQPLGYLHGAGNIVPGLENALAGLSEGDKCDVDVEPEQGYGERDESLVQDVPQGAFDGVDTIEAGMRFQAESDQGMRIIEVVAVDGDVVTVDGNHPLAGETLSFKVKVDSVRDASEEELAHGHVHDGHTHG
jgi:FKBP-type peptidyl-prolyl cis-trans isomerase SlyD